ncbi:MAG: hypothetical protein ACK4ON_09265, partial [Bacteroidia bacterium]
MKSFTFKNLFLALIICAVNTLTLQAQNPVAEWANKIGAGNAQVRFVDVDPTGNVYVAGLFSGSSLTIGSQTITNPTTNHRTFVAKFNSTGTIQWLVGGGSNSSIYIDELTALAVNDNGVIVGGNFNNGSVTFGNTTLNSIGGKDMYLAMYDNNGVFQWLKVFGGNFDDKIGGVCFGTSSNVYITGGFTSSINFGNTTLNAVSGLDVFVTALNISNGSEVWAKSYGGSGAWLTEDGTAIVADFQHVYVTGKYNSSKISFLANDTLYNSSNTDEIFIVKLNQANGNTLWAKTAGGVCNEWPRSIDIDNLNNNGNIYISGFFNCTAYFGADSLTTNGFDGSSTVYSDAFVCKLDNNGNFQWVKGFGGLQFDESYSCYVDYNGKVTVAVNSSSTWGGLTFASQPIPFFTNNDLLVLQYDASGNEVWGKSYSTNDHEFIYSCKGNKTPGSPIYIGGHFEGNSISFDSHTLSASSGINGYFAKLSYSATGIYDIDAFTGINFYPNPANSYIN